MNGQEIAVAFRRGCVNKTAGGFSHTGGCSSACWPETHGGLFPWSLCIPDWDLRERWREIHHTHSVASIWPVRKHLLCQKNKDTHIHTPLESVFLDSRSVFSSFSEIFSLSSILMDVSSFSKDWLSSIWIFSCKNK